MKDTVFYVTYSVCLYADSQEGARKYFENVLENLDEVESYEEIEE